MNISIEEPLPIEKSGKDIANPIKNYVTLTTTQTHEQRYERISKYKPWSK